MSNIVVTYFEPFGGRTTNASKEVVSLLSGYNTKELPVSWSKIPFALDEIFINEPDYLFLVGEAGSYKEISMEKIAHNICNGKDNEDVNKDNEPIIVGDKECKTTLFDLSKLPYRLSDNAGKYLCNYSYYLALSKSKKTKVLFIHVPYIDSLMNNVNSVKEQLEQIIKTLAG